MERSDLSDDCQNGVKKEDRFHKVSSGRLVRQDSNQQHDDRRGKELLSIDRWSIEENGPPGTSLESCANGYSQNVPNCVPSVKCSVKVGSHTVNNNIFQEKCNFVYPDEKSHCLYHKFPQKVNNNLLCPESVSLADGMEEYFKKNEHKWQNGILNGVTTSNSTAHSPSAYIPDLMNPLNGEDEDDDDGCIYTYKGESFEGKLPQSVNTCYSCGLPTTEGITNRMSSGGSLMETVSGSAPSEQSNLFSPDMDFLEMDFDPGSTGDGDMGSDCEDNALHKNDAFPTGSNGFHPEASDSLQTNISDEPSNMCEMCDGKVDNISINHKVGQLESASSDASSCLPVEVNNFQRTCALNVPLENSSAVGDLHLKYNVVTRNHNTVSENYAYNSCDNDFDGESVDNNHAEADYIAELFEDEVSDADVESGEDSNSEALQAPAPELPSCMKLPVVKNFIGEMLEGKDPRRHSSGSNSFSGSFKNLSKENSDASPVKNNNLGSTSAPEVSPVIEFSLSEKFNRSLSFHNQLSSPKYENVCFFPRVRSDDSPRKPGLGLCLQGHEDIEPCNIEACTDRLNCREKKVFNILSSGDTGQQVKQTNPVLSEHNSETQLCELAFSPGPTTSSKSGAEASHSFQVNSLSLKSMQPKTEDPLQDPNTACSDRCLDSEEGSQVPKVMIWTERQATCRQVPQIGSSMCGPTAVLNVLLAFEQNIPLDEVCKVINTRLRAESAPLVDYLLSRSCAGTTHDDLLSGVKSITNGQIVGQFFHMFPKRAVQLSRWLADWIKKGAVPVATLNLQVGVAPGQRIPDAWHHQMVFGVGPPGIYLTNPLECVPDSLLAEQVCTESVLMIRRADIVSHWDQKDKLVRLIQLDDPRWRAMNVLGQVVGILKEQAEGVPLHQEGVVQHGRCHLTSHVSIPAAYKSGVSIFMRKDNPRVSELLQMPQLPLLE